MNSENNAPLLQLKNVHVIYKTDAETVYVTHAGTKYHKDGCTHLNDTKLKLSRTEAIRQGYEPCAVCFPPEEE